MAGLNLTPFYEPPPNEDDRLRYLSSLEILDSPPEPIFDNLTRLAASITRCPMASITFVDRDRVWSKSVTGHTDVEAPRKGSLCAYAVSTNKRDIIVVDDLHQHTDARPVAHVPSLRFFAGAPIVTPEGYSLGALCVGAMAPRTLSTAETDALGTLRDAIVLELEHRRNIVALQKAHRELSAIQDQLRESEELFRALFDNSIDALFLGEPVGTILAANPAAQRMLQRTEEELCRLGRECFVNHKDPNWSLALQAREQHRQFSGDLTVVRKDGAIFPVEITSVIFRDSEGRERTCSIFRDVSDRRAAEARIRESEERLRSIVENAVDVIFRLSLDGQFVSLNPAFERATGWSAHEWIGRPFDSLIHPDDMLAAYSAISLIAHHRVSPSIELRFRSKGGDFRIADFRLTPEVRQDELIGVLGIGRDISRRKEHEAELLQSKKLAEHAAQAKAQFLAVMSHEIRTPLNGIIGMADLLRRSTLTDDQRRYVDTIRLSGDSLLEVINDILDFSKIESGKMTLARQPVRLTGVVHHAMNILQVKAEEKGLRIVASVDDGLPMFIVGDELRLRQVLLNLIGNAIKFSDDGEITVSVSTLTRSDEMLQVLFSVRDNGIGIPTEKMGDLFRPFSQIDATPTRSHGGTGLGLAICASMVGQMGGTIWAESEHGRGSTFYFSIPAVEVKHGNLPRRPAESGALAALPRSASEARVLLAEDNPVNQTVAIEMLRHFGVAPDAVTSGHDVLERCRATAYDIIFMDLEMTGMDGLETSRRIRSDAVTYGHPVIIAMTAYGTDDDRAHCLNAGMDDFLRKPVSLAELERTLTRHLRRGVIPSGPALPATGAELVDAKAIAMLADLGRETASPLVSELIDIYIRFAETQLPLIREAMGKQDFDALRRLIHALKGSSQNLGLSALVALLRQAETNIGNETPSLDDRFPDALEEIYRQTREALQLYTSDRITP